MNFQEYNLMDKLARENYCNQRILAEQLGYSLGKVNSALKTLNEQGYLTADMELTGKARKEIEYKRPQNAVILAAGYGMRMVPVNVEVPKGILEVHGEPLIERQIRQLQEAGIYEIDIVVGFMKEYYEYLIDRYGVKLVFNEDYVSKNNLFSLKKVIDKIGNTYILPCDVWCRDNPFSSQELYSWYMVGEEETEDSPVRVNRKKELILTKGEKRGNRMIGIAYILREDAAFLKEQVNRLSQRREYKNAFWEDALLVKDRLRVYPKEMEAGSVYEINTLEELRELDHNSSQMDSDILLQIQKVLECKADDICNIRALKKGMTNRSFEFTCREKRYIARIPGEGTGKMINRMQEYQVYQELAGKNISDPVCYISPDTGYKITGFVENSRNCDASSPADVKRAMDYLRRFHEYRLEVDHTFDLFGQIEYYELLREGRKSVYKDYEETKSRVYELKKYVDAQPKTVALTHIDAVPDNFLFTEEETYLIDWEYAGMQDVHVDIAMFAIYALYDREQVDRLIDFYFENKCEPAVRTKIYCYIAICGFLWSNWCEYKRMLGVEFGEYSIRQYRYAKEYYRYAKEKMGWHRVDNAVIMAAGSSSRFAPLSCEKPKALLRVRGEILIERQIRQLQEAGIREIIVVTGYLKEQFAYLKEKYHVRLIENPFYESRNNHSTLYAVRKHLKNTYICSGDNYFCENVFRQWEENSFYATVYAEGSTGEWCVQTDASGRIRGVQVGGRDTWVMQGHAFFTEEFSKRLCPWLEEAMQKDEQKKWFWEDIFIAHQSELELCQKKYDADIICEFDNLEELRVFDPAYENATGSEIMKKLAGILQCDEADIRQIDPLKDGEIAAGMTFSCRGKRYQYLYKDEILQQTEGETSEEEI